ncbi:hypothetical protein L1987_69110 [Smallanthus sonchifolius]|uniref:Uncharacterized protein n=1 Tax=Smallanthus sonchifolius TaxID=185202 RepID=A0ACB9B5H8_9ASTR|nr:hypothetical protein L1987_69110 [Smallanthus sonchifolius]
MVESDPRIVALVWPVAATPPLYPHHQNRHRIVLQAAVTEELETEFMELLKAYEDCANISTAIDSAVNMYRSGEQATDFKSLLGFLLRNRPSRLQGHPCQNFSSPQNYNSSSNSLAGLLESLMFSRVQKIQTCFQVQAYFYHGYREDIGSNKMFL